MEKREAQHRLKLLQLIKTFTLNEKLNGQLNLLDEIEKTKNIYKILDRDWTIIVEEIEEALNIFINNQRFDKEGITKVCKALINWFKIIVPIAQNREYISTRRIAYEQLLTFTRAFDQSNSLNEQETLIKQIKEYETLYYYSSKINLLDEVEREKDIYMLLDIDWNNYIIEILQVQSIFVLCQNYKYKDMKQVCIMTSNFNKLFISIAQFRDFISNQRVNYDNLFEYLQRKEE